jgi:hypothetical protein
VPQEVMDALGPWGQLGLIVGSVALIITGFARGWLRPSSSVDREQKHLEGRMADKDNIIEELKAGNKFLMETNRIQATTIAQFIEVGKTSNAALTALPRAGVDST